MGYFGTKSTREKGKEWRLAIYRGEKTKAELAAWLEQYGSEWSPYTREQFFSALDGRPAPKWDRWHKT